MSNNEQDSHRNVSVSAHSLNEVEESCMSTGAQLMWLRVTVALTAAGTGLFLYALIDEVTWMPSQNLSLGLSVGCCLGLALSIIRHMWLSYQMSVRQERFRRLRQGKDTRHVFAYGDNARDQAGRRESVADGINAEESDSIYQYCVNLFNCCIGRQPLPGPNEQVAEPASNLRVNQPIIVEQQPLVIPSSTSPSDAALMVSVGKLNGDLIKAINVGNETIIGQILNDLAKTSISADLLRVTGIGKTVNQIQGPHRTQAQHLVSSWRTIVAPTLTRNSSNSSNAPLYRNPNITPSSGSLI